MALGAPTNGLGAIESSLLFCYSLTCNGLNALSCPFKMALNNGCPSKSLFQVLIIAACKISFHTQSTVFYYQDEVNRTQEYRALSHDLSRG